MIEGGIQSLGTDLKNFGNSNTFKDFVSWLQQNGPTIGETSRPSARTWASWPRTSLRSASPC